MRVFGLWVCLVQAYCLDIRKKTQGEKNTELKEKTKTLAQNSESQHFIE